MKKKSEEKTGNTVLITGATSGIGFELARNFAQQAFHLVLVARNEEDLKETAKLMAREGAAEVTILPADLSVPDTALAIYNQTKLLGIEVDMLVNNAAMGEYGFFAENDLAKEMALIQLNLVSVVQLTKLYMQHMISKRYGKILQVASLSSYQPTPKLAVYAATKSFVLSFSDAVANELKGTGVTMTALIPSATATNFFRRAGMQHTRVALNDLEDPAFVAQIGFESMMRGDAHAVVPGVKMQILRDTFRTNGSIAQATRKQMEEIIPRQAHGNSAPVGRSMSN